MKVLLKLSIAGSDEKPKNIRLTSDMPSTIRELLDVGIEKAGWSGKNLEPVCIEQAVASSVQGNSNDGLNVTVDDAPVNLATYVVTMQETTTNGDPSSTTMDPHSMPSNPELVVELKALRARIDAIEKRVASPGDVSSSNMEAHFRDREVERLKKELETERKEAQRLRSLLRIAEDTTRMERQEKERLLTEVARLQQSQYRQEAGGRKILSQELNGSNSTQSPKVPSGPPTGRPATANGTSAPPPPPLPCFLQPRTDRKHVVDSGKTAHGESVGKPTKATDKENAKSPVAVEGPKPPGTQQPRPFLAELQTHFQKKTKYSGHPTAATHAKPAAKNPPLSALDSNTDPVIFLKKALAEKMKSIRKDDDQSEHGDEDAEDDEWNS